ncbi:translocation protein TolB [Cohnella sp.]|uniref:translocation protein TolB n=1 Tax=Cohnella sp. TaxID=1883426 RepID=UPI003562C2E5
MGVLRNCIFVMVTALLITGNATAYAEPSVDTLKAAFVRNGDLWLKVGSIEHQLTKGEFIRSPKWSYDGQWIAYTKGKEEQELWLWHVPSEQSQLVSPIREESYEWAPRKNKLAFLLDQKLIFVEPEKPTRRVDVASGIGNYSWLPDGSGFLASTQSILLPDGWTPIRILSIPLLKVGDPSQIRTLYVLPKPSEEFFAVTTSIFKWSATGHWIAFLANPTASLSADSNILCVLSAEGTSFKQLDLMANNSQWFNWSDMGDLLAYIGGVGREATSNKKLKLADIPTGKLVTYTPAGYVDQSFTWHGPRRLVASRAAESASRPFPSLVEVKLGRLQAKPLTDESNTYGDFNPISLPSRLLAWVRSDRIKADAIVAGSSGKNPVVFIPGIDLGANFYEQWRWSDVLSFYTGERHSKKSSNMNMG